MTALEQYNKEVEKLYEECSSNDKLTSYQRWLKHLLRLTLEEVGSTASADCFSKAYEKIKHETFWGGEWD